MSNSGGMRRHYAALSTRMQAEMDGISAQMDSNPGEKGVNNEKILEHFLKDHLPTRYTVSSGKVVASDGSESTQMDLIIHDRLLNPAFSTGYTFSIVPIECVSAVISVKTTLDRTSLTDALDQIASVRRLPRNAALLISPEATMEISQAPRPRGLVFGFKSKWTSAESANSTFQDVLGEYPDNLRPNGVCLLDQAFISRTPYETETHVYSEFALMHFFVFLARIVDTFPKLHVDLTKYFEEYDEPMINASPALSQ